MTRREAMSVLVSLPMLKSVEVARVTSDDVIVAECESLLSESGRAYVSARLKEIWPQQRIVVCDAGLRLKVLRNA